MIPKPQQRDEPEPKQKQHSLTDKHNFVNTQNWLSIAGQLASLFSALNHHITELSQLVSYEK